MGHGRGVCGETFHAAERLREREAAQVGDEIPNGSFAADKLERNQRSEPVLLLPRDIMAVMLRPAGIMQARDGTVAGKDVDNDRSILLVDANTCIERSKAAQGQEESNGAPASPSALAHQARCSRTAESAAITAPPTTSL